MLVEIGNVWFNPEHITAIKPIARDKFRSEIYMIDGVHWMTYATPQLIESLIDQAKKKKAKKKGESK